MCQLVKAKLFLCFSIILTFIATNVLAISGGEKDLDFEDQKFIVSPSSTIVAVISKKEISRISFEEEIVSLNSLKDELEYSFQGSDIYLKPLVDKPINFFATTLSGVTYKFIVTSEDITSTQIFINADRVRDVGKDGIEGNEQNQRKSVNYPAINYQEYISEEFKEQIGKIINVALKPRKYLGYEIKQVDRRLSNANPNLSMRLKRIISGNNLIAEKIYVVNRSKVIQLLDVKEFINKDSSNLGAVLLTKESLAPSETCILIRVFEN